MTEGVGDRNGTRTAEVSMEEGVYTDDASVMVGIRDILWEFH
jgi:hypothetical protein